MFNYYILRIKKDPLSTEAKQSPRKLLRPSPAKKQNKMISETKKNSNVSSHTPTTTPVKQEREHEKPLPPSSPDRKIGQKIGMRLRNLLKLPKAHKWVCYEWFYSNIDKYVLQ